MDFREKLSQQLNEIGGTNIESVFNKLVQMTKSFNGKVYLVGGAVRDELMGKESKDYDFLITKITLEDLAKKLQQTFPHAKVNEVGQSFGVVKLSFGGDEFDFAIPRTDVDRENVKTDPNIPVEHDLMRRDFSFNALAKDLETGQIINPEGFDGVQDIKNKIIRAVGNPEDRFREDPLRILRCLQFSARFGFTIEPNTLKAIQENVDLLTKVSAERFYEEFNKAWTKGNADTELFFKLLKETHVGLVMFGKDFNPIPIDTHQFSGHNKFIAQAIAAFLNGGDFERLILKSDEQDIIKTSRWFKNIIQTGIDYKTIKLISKFGQYFTIIKNVFSVIDKDLSSQLDNILSKPLIPKMEAGKQEPWELPVTGGEIMELSKENGTELKGKAVSETVLKLIKAYQDSIIAISDNNKESIKDFLKSILNESDVKRIKILHNRINNIFYK